MVFIDRLPPVVDLSKAFGTLSLTKLPRQVISRGTVGGQVGTYGTVAGGIYRGRAGSFLGTVYGHRFLGTVGSFTRLVPSVTGQTASGSYTGNGSATKAITGLGFKPRAVYLQNRSNVGVNFYMQVAGSQLRPLLSMNESAQMNIPTAAVGIASFDADGFTAKTAGGSSPPAMNRLNNVYVYMAWK